MQACAGRCQSLLLVTDSRTHGHGTELCQGRARLGIRKHFCAVRVVRHWHRLPSRVVGALCLSVFTRHLDNALTNMLWLLKSPEEVRKLDYRVFEGFFQLNLSILLLT